MSASRFGVELDFAEEGFIVPHTLRGKGGEVCSLNWVYFAAGTVGLGKNPAARHEIDPRPELNNSNMGGGSGLKLFNSLPEVFF